MRIYTKAGDLAFSTFSFPDGQPHFKLESWDIDFSSATIEVALQNTEDLFLTMLAADVLRRHGYTRIDLDIRYLLGARMDRPIDSAQPFTLDVVARLVNSAGFAKVRVLDAHSPIALQLIRGATNVLPKSVVQQVVAASLPDYVCIPDKGAVERVQALVGATTGLLYAEKERDPQTGKLSGHVLNYYHSSPHDKVLIVDDICDGGGTFTGLAKVLRQWGAGAVDLFVTHGIFSKALPLAGVDHIYCTDSLNSPVLAPRAVTVIPISMKEIL